ncbi:transcriptional regulator, partial [Clostridium perfringens]|nr:transcriptional regulator [Clostridium perfringens]
FTTERGPFGKLVADAWQAVWALTAASGIERTYTGDFERYDERCQDPENAVVELYIAIK